MTFQEIPPQIEWLIPWERLKNSGDGLVNELRKELSSSHPLYGVEVAAIAHRGDCDDVLFATADPLKPFAVVHLTWTRHVELDSRWPSTAYFHGWQDWVERCLIPDHRDYFGLERIELVPVLRLEALRFATQDRAVPSESRQDMPGEWLRFWKDSLADSGLGGLDPVVPGSEFVETRAISTNSLEKILRKLIKNCGRIDSLADTGGGNVMEGGIILRSFSGGVLIEPGCRSDFGTIQDWHAAANYRSNEWSDLWIGHPWVSVRFQDSSLLISEAHEQGNPIAHLALSPEKLLHAIEAAKDELRSFAAHIARLLPGMGYGGDAEAMAHRMAGLAEDH